MRDTKTTAAARLFGLAAVAIAETTAVALPLPGGAAVRASRERGAGGAAADPPGRRMTGAASAALPHFSTARGPGGPRRAAFRARTGAAARLTLLTHNVCRSFIPTGPGSPR